MSVQIVYQTASEGLDSLDLDATLQLCETRTVQATEHPVETGAVVTDHVIMRPKVLRVEGIITATPVMQGSMDQQNGTFGLQPFSNDLIDLEGNGAIGPDRFRAHDALEVLRQIHDARQTVTVGTGLGDPQAMVVDLYENMVIETLELPRDPSTGDAVHVSMTLKEIRTVDSEEAPIPAALLRGAAQDKGKQATKPADPPTQASASALYQLTHGRP